MPQRRMVEPTIEEVSGVDLPAHLAPGWLIMKSAGGEMPEFDKSKLDAEALAYVTELESRVTKAEDAATDTDADAFEKAVSQMPAPQRALFRKQQRELAVEKAKTADLFEASESAKFLELAKSLSHLPKVVVADAATTLRKAANGDGAAVGEMYEMLAAADAYIAANDQLTKELGSSFDGPTGGALDQLNDIAKALVVADPTLSEADAMTKAATLHPNLYAQHLQEA